MRMFFTTVGVLAWVLALAVLWIFKESGGALTVIASGVFAIVAMVALGSERIIKTLEEIRDSSVTRIRFNDAADTEIPREIEVQSPVGVQPIA